MVGSRPKGWGGMVLAAGGGLLDGWGGMVNRWSAGTAHVTKGFEPSTQPRRRCRLTAVPAAYCRGPSRRDAASTSAPGQLAARRRRARRCAQLLRWYACVVHRTARRCDCTACRPHNGREASDKRRFPWRRPRSQQAEGAKNCRHDGPAGRTDALSRGLRESRPRALHLQVARREARAH